MFRGPSTVKLVHRGVLMDRVTLSIGIEAFPDHGESARELLDLADKALYESKNQGRDRVTLARRQNSQSLVSVADTKVTASIK